MRFGGDIWCLIAILAKVIFADERGILTGLLNNVLKPPRIDLLITSEPDTDSSDECPRQYPLLTRFKQQVPYAFKRYGVVPDLIPNPPNLLLEVCYGHWDKVQR